jgi:alginate O-acetyltransferase complex protein AlgJ
MSEQGLEQPALNVSTGDLRAEDIAAVFREFLGREATPGDIAVSMQSATLRAFLDGVMSSEEYRQRVARREMSRSSMRIPYLNCWIDGWEPFARPVGELSPDGVVIIGQRGYLFIYGGTNNNVASHRGEVPAPEGWLEAWQRLIAERCDFARRTGRRVAFLVVPEKLAVYDDVFPQDLTPRGQRPVLSLLEQGGLALVYPEQALRGARPGGETYLRTDSHLTPRGNLLLALATLRELGVPTTALPEELRYAPHAHLGAGDLGQHFDPPVLEVMTPLADGSLATLVSDNWAEITAIGGHIGTRRIFRHNDAPDHRTVVVFGDSYSFGDEAYQGLSWFLAQVFREVHFIWVPFGWDPDYVDTVGAELVVCQTAERFIGRVPERSIDVMALMRETTSIRRPLTEERIFSDRAGESD